MIKLKSNNLEHIINLQNFNKKKTLCDKNSEEYAIMLEFQSALLVKRNNETQQNSIKN